MISCFFAFIFGSIFCRHDSSSYSSSSDDENEKEIKTLYEKYTKFDSASRMFELAIGRSLIENRFLGFKGKEVANYNKILAEVINGSSSLEKYGDKISENRLKQSDLWKFGISGDLPILLIRIKDVNDMYVVKDALKAFEFFRSKNVKIDLVILNEEKNSYEHFIKFEIENEIQNRQLAFLKNSFGGIFVVNEKEISKEDVDLLEFRCNLELNSSLGKIETQIQDLEEEYQEKITNIGEDNKPMPILNTEIESLPEDYSNLKYYNDYGGFTEDGLEYKIKLNKNNKLPTAWSNILANPNFGTVVTQNLGGFTWSKNSRLNRVSTFSNNPVIDIPPEIIYLKNKKTGMVWSLSENITNEQQEYYLKYGFGYVILKTIKNQIIQELETFVAKENKIKINILKLTNTSGEKKTLKILKNAKYDMRI